MPKDGKPIRGLIQDSVLSASYLTSKDNFLTKEIYQQLLYIATWNIVNTYSGREKRIILLKPAIMRPKPLWTGSLKISLIYSKFKSIIYRETINFQHFESSGK